MAPFHPVKMIRISHYFIIIILFLFFALSCGERSNEGDVVVHPVEEKIPYSDVPSKMLEVLNAGDHLDELPDNIQLLYEILLDDNLEVDSVELDLLTSSKIDLTSLNDSTIVILDKEQNQLVSYNLSKHKAEVIAEQGRGPGDLIFSEELSVRNNGVYVASQNFQITVFNCQTGKCVHEKIFQTDYSTFSISPTQKFLYYLGIIPYGHEGRVEKDSESLDQFSVHRANIDGEVVSSFLPVYKDNSPLVSNRIMSKGRVRSFSEFDRIIITFQYFPYLFIHSLDGKLLDKYELPGFKEAKNIESKVGELGTTLTFNGDYTYLRYTKKINEEWLLLKTQEFRDVNYVFLDQEIYGDTWYSYYIYSLDSKRIYKIGDDITMDYGQSKKYHLSDSGVFFNNEGKVHWIKN